ncbi:hypothetical protein JCM10213_008843 [Rhodosporidiobolus nylandii]
MSLSALKQAIAKHGLLGSSVMPRDFVPSLVVGARYPNNEYGFPVEPGETYPVQATQEQPTIAFSAEEGGKYTLALLDPDAPSREEPKWGPFRHWLISGLKPGSPVFVERETLTPYMGPAPPAGTGPHRYVFLLYREPDGAPPTFSGDKEARKQCNIKEFVEENKLKLVGANFFLAAKKGKE